MALSWINSYLRGWKQTVKIAGLSSSVRDLVYGVLQDSVLGPFLFSVNLLPCSKIFLSHNVPYELYTDDNQLYIVFNRTEAEAPNASLGSLVRDTLQWLTDKFQKVNVPETEMMILSSMHLPDVIFPQFSVVDNIVLSLIRCVGPFIFWNVNGSYPEYFWCMSHTPVDQ